MLETVSSVSFPFMKSNTELSIYNLARAHQVSHGCVLSEVASSPAETATLSQLYTSSLQIDIHSILNSFGVLSKW
jgi:hypothetical protein